MATLTWSNDNNHYHAELEDGSTLFVGGDEYAESKFEMAQAYLLEAHPGLERGEPFHAYIREHEAEWTACLDKTEDELNGVSTWATHAISLEPGQDVSDIDYHVSAWIEPAKVM